MKFLLYDHDGYDTNPGFIYLGLYFPRNYNLAGNPNYGAEVLELYALENFAGKSGHNLDVDLGARFGSGGDYYSGNLNNASLDTRDDYPIYECARRYVQFLIDSRRKQT